MTVCRWLRAARAGIASLALLTGCRSDKRAVLRTSQAAGAAWLRGDIAAFEPLVDHEALMTQLFAHCGEKAFANQHNVWPNLLARDSATARAVTRVARRSPDPYVVVLTRLHPMYRVDPSESLRLAVLGIGNDSATVGVIGRVPGVAAVDSAYPHSNTSQRYNHARPAPIRYRLTLGRSAARRTSPVAAPRDHVRCIAAPRPIATSGGKATHRDRPPRRVARCAGERGRMLTDAS